MPTVAEKFISDNGAKVHDRIRISTDAKTYEGFLLPRHNFSGEDIVVLKLDNGYNIGVSVEDAELAILSKAKKDKVEFTKKKKNKELKDITVLATGGTIASFVDYKTGAVSPAITAEQLVNSVSALDKVANIDAEPLFSLASEDMA
ncbi:MAG: asparaginase domain-containing protein, partial [SAR324 cluster bacterium]|nr:asparaginase domain-containing protein [SAR324 cluster bacterium]